MNNKLIADVSVIIPVYNSGMTLKRAIDSVFKQTVKPKEIIIIDDCSTDSKTKNILNEIIYEQDNIVPITVLYSEKNKGAGSARNLGWNKATGKYIAFLDSDDIWHPKKVEVQYKYMEENSEIVFSCHHMDALDIENDNDNENKAILDIQLAVLNQQRIININPIRYLFIHYPRGGTSFVMLRNINLRFKEEKRYSEDYLLWLETNFLHKGVLLDIVMAYSFKHRYGANGLSKNLWKMEKGEIETFNLLKKNGYISFPIMISAVCFSFLKYLYRQLICMIKIH